ncbi:hypothetical protein T484DRAFT_1979897, partial [Baffinella frigidus]
MGWGHAMASERMPSERPVHRAGFRQAASACHVLRLGEIPQVTVVDCPATLRQCSRALAGQQILALELKGIHLPPRLEISLIQIATPAQCFILDVQGKPANAPVVILAKQTLEDPTVSKIVHDCRTRSGTSSASLSTTSTTPRSPSP